jgi:hypothetical protein
MPLNYLVDSGNPIKSLPEVQRTTLSLDVMGRFFFCISKSAVGYCIEQRRNGIESPFALIKTHQCPGSRGNNPSYVHGSGFAPAAG